MSYLPDVQDGTIFIKKDKKVKSGSKRRRVVSKKPTKKAREAWKEYYASIEFIKHL